MKYIIIRLLQFTNAAKKEKSIWCHSLAVSYIAQVVEGRKSSTLYVSIRRHADLYFIKSPSMALKISGHIVLGRTVYPVR